MPLIDYVPGYATFKALNSDATAPNQANSGLGAVQAAWNLLNDTTVFVWEPHNGVGHASIMIGNAPAHHGPDQTDYYASWFPGGAGVQGKQDLVKDLGRYACSFEEDCLSEGDGNGGYRIPEHRITITGLNVAAMHARWVNTRNNDAIYNLLQNNCSTIAARVLRDGLSLYQSVRYAYWAHCIYWTPTDVRKFASTLQ